MSKFYKDQYDVVIVGGALAGLSAALRLLDDNYDVLVLEQHNLPGGVATSFVRGGVEFEASLHEMVSIGSQEQPLRIREYLDKHDVHVDWLDISDAYRYISNHLNVVIRAGQNGDFSLPARDIADACGDRMDVIYNKLMDFFSLCHKVWYSANHYNDKKLNKLQLIKKHPEFVKVLGYSALEVMVAYQLPPTAIEILSAYWMYLGSPIDDLPFLLFGYIIADYIGHGPHLPAHTSYEISLKMLESVERKGGQVELGQKVEKILVKDKKAYAVKLTNGTIIKGKHIIAGAYPNTVYSEMIEPKEEVPSSLIKIVNGMELGVSCFSVVMLLDKDYKDLGIRDYATFYAPHGLDTSLMYEKGKAFNKWDYLTSVCMNVLNKDASPKGTCIYSITYLPNGESFKDVEVNNYEDYKNAMTEHFLKLESQRLGVNLKDHILEIIVETPITIAHYVGSYNGGIYGYRHSMNNHSAARTEMKDENYFSNLYFVGAHTSEGDGMGPAIQSGKVAAEEIIKNDKGGNK